jgi:hypothetical protein
MSIHPRSMLATAAALMTLAWSAPTQALTMQECSAKYRAAQTAGTLKGMKWNEFRRAECATDAAAVPAGTTGRGNAAAEPAPTTARASASAAAFPSAVSAKYASESPGKARMHTCLDQYHANKTGNGNGGLRWIQKGGGYYSECNKKLSGR